MQTSQYVFLTGGLSLNTYVQAQVREQLRRSAGSEGLEVVTGKKQEM
jgi:hypothetical protein